MASCGRLVIGPSGAGYQGHPGSRRFDKLPHFGALPILPQKLEIVRDPVVAARLVSRGGVLDPAIVVGIDLRVPPGQQARHAIVSLRQGCVSGLGDAAWVTSRENERQGVAEPMSAAD